jgi:hypothetical protein
VVRNVQRSGYAQTHCQANKERHEVFHGRVRRVVSRHTDGRNKLYEIDAFEAENMKKIAYEHRRFNAETLRTIEQAEAIIASYQAQGFSLTLRQLYYHFVARGLIPNTEKPYTKIENVARVPWARLTAWIVGHRGELSDDSVVDRGDANANAETQEPTSHGTVVEAKHQNAKNDGNNDNRHNHPTWQSPPSWQSPFSSHALPYLHGKLIAGSPGEIVRPSGIGCNKIYEIAAFESEMSVRLGRMERVSLVSSRVARKVGRCEKQDRSDDKRYKAEGDALTHAEVDVLSNCQRISKRITGQAKRLLFGVLSSRSGRATPFVISFDSE